VREGFSTLLYPFVRRDRGKKKGLKRVICASEGRSENRKGVFIAPLQVCGGGVFVAEGFIFPPLSRPMEYSSIEVLHWA